MYVSFYDIIYKIFIQNHFSFNALIEKVQGILVPKLTLGPFLTLSVRNGLDLQSYLFQENISLNPRRVDLQTYAIYL